MNKAVTAVWDYVKGHPYPVLMALFLLWMSFGIFPLQCYETDGQEVILGCDVMYREGWSLPPVYSYEYRMQPLTTILVVALKHVLPFLTCEQIYCFNTVVASLFFLFGCISFVQHITKAPKTLILVAAMLLPEMYAIAMYPNTAIPAVACFVWALIMLSRGRYWLTGLLLCVAVLFRLDVVIVFPAVFPLLIFEGKSFKQAISLSALFGVVVVVVCLFFFWLLGADALKTFDAYEEWNGLITSGERIVAIVGFYSLAYFLQLPVGVVVIIARRYWKELFLVLLPIVLLHSVFSSFGNASKHFLYNAPFVIIAGVRALSWLMGLLRNRPVLKWVALAGVLLYTTVSVRKCNLTMPWLTENPLSKVGMLTTLYETERGETGYSVGIGAGFQLVTNDENMLLTGHLFYPWYIQAIKQITGDWHRQQTAVLDKAPTSNILTLEYGASAPIASDYLTEDYRFRQLEKMPSTYRYTLFNEQRELHFWRIVWKKAITDKQEVVAYIDSVAADFPDGDAYLVPACNHYGSSYFMDELVPDGVLEKKADKLYKIVRKK